MMPRNNFTSAIFLCLLTILIGISDIMAKDNTSYIPDFAYPETVIERSKAVMEHSGSTADYRSVLRAAMDMCIARSLKDIRANVSDVTAMMDSLACKTPSPWSNLALLVEADLYSSFYEEETYTYNRRILPLDEPWPQQVGEWSAGMFATKVLDIVTQATSGIDTPGTTAFTMPVTELGDLITVDKHNIWVNNLSVADFIELTGANILKRLSSRPDNVTIPFFSVAEEGNSSPQVKCWELQNLLISSVVQRNRRSGNSIAEAIALKEALSFDDYSELYDLLEQLRDKEGFAVLSTSWNVTRDWTKNKSVYAWCRHWLEIFRKSPLAPQVKDCIFRLESKDCLVDIPNNMVVGVEATGTATLTNVDKAYLLLLPVKSKAIDKVGNLIVENVTAPASFTVIPLTTSEAIPFQQEVEFSIGPLGEGFYVGLISNSPKLPADWKKQIRHRSSLINVSAISLLTIGHPQDDSLRIYTVDAHNHKPLRGVRVSIYSSGKNIINTKTDSTGCVRISKNNRYLEISATKGNSRCYLSTYATMPDKQMSNTTYYNIFTDLSIYRPGDTVHFSAIGWVKGTHECILLAGSGMTAELLDANNNVVATQRLVTDSWGRANGKFLLNADGLLGEYRIRVENSGMCSFEVADYKLPQFYVTAEQTQSQSSESDSIAFKGEVKTYTGLPLPGSVVKYTVSYIPWRWNWRPNNNANATYSNETIADSNGSFSIKLPLERLKGTPFEKGTFRVGITATSPDGDTQDAPSLTFSLGNAYNITPDIPEKIEIKNNGLKINVRVTDESGMPLPKELEFEVIDKDGNEVANGTFLTPVTVIDAERIPSGEYMFKFRLSDDSTEVEAEAHSVLFRSHDSNPPLATPLWVPFNNLTAEPNEETVKVIVGSGYKDTWIYYAINSGSTPIKEGWIKSDSSNVAIEVPSPKGFDVIEVLFSGMHNLKSREERVRILSAKATEKLQVQTESFRNHLSAGDKETWRFKFTTDRGSNTPVAAMAVLTDKALNAIAPFRWYFSPSLLNYLPYVRLSRTPQYRQSIYGDYSQQHRYSTISFEVPQWLTYGYPLLGNRYRFRLYADGANGMVYERRLMAKTAATADFATEETMDDMETEAFDAGNPETVAGSISGQPVVEPDVELRPVELPVAFFMPTLESDQEGNVTIKFDVPDFNTTWQFQLLGYNRELQVATTLLDAIASKPVMARANMPMYLRTGDKALLKALLFNNADTMLAIAGRIQILNTLDGGVIAEKYFPAMEISPSANREIEIEFDCPTDLSQIEVRVYALSPGFSDGEGKVIPIYPSSTPVIESEQFYLGSGTKEISFQMPKLKKDVNVTFRYCANPVWECMLSLPAIAEPDSKSALVVAQALYANSMSVKITSQFPQIKQDLDRLFLTDAYKELVSNLQADAQLKVVGLNQTPWVNNALNEQQRMLRLGSLLDSLRATRAIENLCRQLAKLQNVDGGWSWCEGMQSSLFITEEVLLECGEMLRAGCLPHDALDMVAQAFRYCDDKLVADYKRHGKIYANGLLEYLYTKSFFSDIPAESKDFAQIRKQALNEIRSGWRSFTVRDKAEAALLFYRLDRHDAVVSDIMKSLYEFINKDESKGWWLGNQSADFNGWTRLLNTAITLNAFAEIDPESAAVDGLRQWLLLQKETEDWGSRSLTAQVVQSILASGTSWGTDVTLPKVKVGGTAIDLGDQLPAGVLTVTLNPSEVSGKKVTISKDGATPSWGAIISQYVAPMKDVKATGCENLNIRKQVLVIEETAQGAIAVRRQPQVGDKVRITLTVDCDKDMDYVVIVDERGACIQPDEWLSGYAPCGDFFTYRETRDNRTTFMVEFLPKGSHVITYDCHIDRLGSYSTGIATVQSIYAPQNVAHSAAQIITVR